jgi:hypothetical protein
MSKQPPTTASKKTCHEILVDLDERGCKQSETTALARHGTGACGCLAAFRLDGRQTHPMARMIISLGCGLWCANNTRSRSRANQSQDQSPLGQGRAFVLPCEVALGEKWLQNVNKPRTMEEEHGFKRTKFLCCNLGPMAIHSICRASAVGTPMGLMKDAPVGSICGFNHSCNQCDERPREIRGPAFRSRMPTTTTTE